MFWDSYLVQMISFQFQILHGTKLIAIGGQLEKLDDKSGEKIIDNSWLSWSSHPSILSRVFMHWQQKLREGVKKRPVFVVFDYERGEGGSTEMQKDYKAFL